MYSNGIFKGLFLRVAVLQSGRDLGISLISLLTVILLSTPIGVKLWDLIYMINRVDYSKHNRRCPFKVLQMYLNA